MRLSGMRILLAEDNPTNQMVAMQMLDTLGASVALAQDGVEALEIARRTAFDLMLIDIEMPRLSGIEVIRDIRAAEPPMSEMPLIALTAYVMREHREPIMAAGADGIIAKPIVSIDDFADEILRLAARRGHSRPGMAGQERSIVSDIGDGLIDRTIFNQLADSIGPEAMSELLERVGEDLGAAGDRARKGMETGDFGEVRAATHIMTSVAGAIGATGLLEASRRTNKAAHCEDGATVAAEGAEMMTLLERVCAHVGPHLLR